MKRIIELLHYVSISAKQKHTKKRKKNPIKKMQTGSCIQSHETIGLNGHREKRRAKGLSNLGELRGVVSTIRHERERIELFFFLFFLDLFPGKGASVWRQHGFLAASLYFGARERGRKGGVFEMHPVVSENYGYAIAIYARPISPVQN